MLKDLLRREFIKEKVEAGDWKDAIHQGALPLYREGLIEQRYERAIIENFHKLGPYMVISPGIVLSHAAPEAGVNAPGISIINLKEPIAFGHALNDPVVLVITLAFQSAEQAKVLSELMEILTNEKTREVLMHTSVKEEMEKILIDRRSL